MPTCVGCSRSSTFAGKKTLHATERDKPAAQEEREKFCRDIVLIPPEKLHFIDETGVNVAMARRYARAFGGERAHGAVPKNWGDNMTIVGSLNLDGDIHAMSLPGSIDGESFTVYIQRVLCPKLKPGDVVVMDNLGVHKVKAVRLAIEKRGAELRYLPPYSPEFNPIEKCWSKIKEALRAAAARSREALDRAVTDALNAVTPTDAQGWFISCGYSL